MDWYKGTFIFVAGAAVGAVLSYLYAKMELEKRYSDKAEAEIKDMEEYFTSKFNPAKREPKRLKQETDLEIGDSSIENLEPVERRSYGKERMDISEDDYVDEELYEEEEFDEPYATDYPRDDPAEDPYTITPHQFSTECDAYSKTKLFYYAGNNTLVDEEDELVDNWNIIGGKSSLKRFGEYEEGVVYVRNERIGADFEIRRKRGSFTEIHAKD